LFHRLTARQPKVALSSNPPGLTCPPTPTLLPLVLWSVLADIRCCDHALVILSYTIRVAVNLEGVYGKSNQCASAASCGATRSAVARGEVRPSDFRDRVAKSFRNISERKTSNPNCLGSFTTENGEGAKGEMGEGSEGTRACSENNWPGSCKAHHFVSRTQEDRSGAKSAVGEAEGGAEESGVNTHKARCVGGGLFSLMRNHNDLPDGLGNTCDRARLHCHSGSLLPQTRSAMPQKRTENLPPSSSTNSEFRRTQLPCRDFSVPYSTPQQTPRLSSIGESWETAEQK